MEPFQHIVIIGCGLLGTSLGMDVRKARLAGLVTGVGRANSTSLAVARARGAIDRATDDIAAAVSGNALPGELHDAPSADLVVVCTPVRQFPETFKRLAPALAPGAIVTDVGSTKTHVMEWAAQFLPSHAAFIGSHPMAGSEKSGPEAAREGLYQNAVCLVCNANPAALKQQQRLVELWRAVGMRIITCQPQQHDRWVATVSHLPHVVAGTLVHVASTDSAALEAAAGGFIDTTRIASGDPTMWTDIVLTNRTALAQLLAAYEAKLAEFRHAVEAGDESAIHAHLAGAKIIRDAFIAKRNSRSVSHAMTNPPPIGTIAPTGSAGGS